jgi:hypothetical protein
MTPLEAKPDGRHQTQGGEFATILVDGIRLTFLQVGSTVLEDVGDLGSKEEDQP